MPHEMLPTSSAFLCRYKVLQNLSFLMLHILARLNWCIRPWVNTLSGQLYQFNCLSASSYGSFAICHLPLFDLTWILDLYFEYFFIYTRGIFLFYFLFYFFNSVYTFSDQWPTKYKSAKCEGASNMKQIAATTQTTIAATTVKNHKNRNSSSDLFVQSTENCICMCIKSKCPL